MESNKRQAARPRMGRNSILDDVTFEGGVIDDVMPF
jgi:hypothetical protein